MLKLLSAAGLALAMAAGGAAVTAPAQAQDVEFRIGPDGVRPVVRDRERERDRDRREARMRGCSEREARAAARQYGFRDPEVIRQTRSRVIVEGETRRGIREITFANEPGCPEL
ncbi:hypothetical protein [Limoniibacter endophyticus]|uniref:UrcA family protein n=1 Tax=Limoniibacter endophyticus TaxID=1565040 RepID=A0A8J3GH54_9HYPH|nr:hypothetical protein [Limoniibacter endophyticus]GHC69682.1 hypothetical protein GCM10010136_15770 [Limoniibacter endophyticus]